LTEGTPQNLGGAIACAPVIRRIAGEARRENVRHVGRVRGGSRVAIQIALEDRRLGPPELEVILGPERRDEAVVAGHIEQREGSRILRKRAALRGRNLPRGQVEDEGRRRDRVKARRIGPILLPLREIAGYAADPLQLVVVLCVSLAGERGRWTRGKLRNPRLAAGGARHTERRHVLPLKSDSAGGR